MKLLRIGKKGNEKPAVMDKDGKIRDLSSPIQDLKPDHLNDVHPLPSINRIQA